MRTLGIAIALALTVPAVAQDYAKARVDASPRHLEWVELKHGERTVKAFVAYPEVKEKAPVVIVIHEIFGLTDWVQSVCDQLAEHGVIAIAPDFLSEMGPDKGRTTSFGDVGLAREAIGNLRPKQITADLDAAFAYAQTLPASNGHISVAGFCWGGTQTFRYATHQPKLKAAYVFYGTAPDNAADLESIACPVYGFYGGNDSRVNASLPDTEKHMKAAKKKFESVIYDEAGHGFMRAGEADNAQKANVDGRAAAWKRWLELIRKH